MTNFARFTQEPEGLPIYIRSARVLAVAQTPEGTRIFVGGGWNCLVAETVETVIQTLARPADEA
jgi:hypothetical protein